MSKNVISISNIAWDISHDQDVAKLLRAMGVTAIDVAPSKYFADIPHTSEAEIRQIRDIWVDRGFEIVGMQSLLYGTKNLNVFGNTNSQNALLEHLKHVCRIGAGLGANKLVFGSPRNRDRAGLSDSETSEVALSFFDRLGTVASEEGVLICLEPNPTCYGANFLTTLAETISFVRELGHPAVRVQLDTGALFINGESPHLITEAKELIGHIHVSEPDLSPLGTEQVNHEAVSKALNAVNHAPRTIEMLIKDPENESIAIEQAVRLAQHYYGEAK